MVIALSVRMMHIVRLHVVPSYGRIMCVMQNENLEADRHPSPAKMLTKTK